MLLLLSAASITARTSSFCGPNGGGTLDEISVLSTVEHDCVA